VVRALGRYSIAVHTRLALSAVMVAVAVKMELIPSVRSQAWYVPGRSEMRKDPALSPQDDCQRHLKTDPLAAPEF